jgi:hypothetical protein
MIDNCPLMLATDDLMELEQVLGPINEKIEIHNVALRESTDRHRASVPSVERGEELPADAARTRSPKCCIEGPRT